MQIEKQNNKNNVYQVVVNRCTLTNKTMLN